MIVHFHGIGKALRESGDNPRDVDHYQFEQQLDAFAAAARARRSSRCCRSASRPENAEGKHGVSFGNFNTDEFMQAAFGELGGALPSGSTPGDVIMSAHSGGGLQLGGMLASGKGLPGASEGRVPVRGAARRHRQLHHVHHRAGWRPTCKALEGRSPPA